VLRTFIRQYLIKEAAATVNDALTQGLALYQDDHEGRLLLVLFDPNEVIYRLEDGIAHLEGMEWYEVGSFIESTSYVYGVVLGVEQQDVEDTGPCWNAYQIFGPAARQKYGPMMYDIAMSIAPNKTLTSDKIFGSSESAKAVWDYYRYRRTDVEKLPMDDIENPKTPSPEDDCMLMGDPALDHAYKMKGTINVNELRERYEDMLDKTKEMGIPQTAIEDALLKSAEGFYGSRRDEEDRG
jgi:hypothetical protein